MQARRVCDLDLSSWPDSAQDIVVLELSMTLAGILPLGKIREQSCVSASQRGSIVLDSSLGIFSVCDVLTIKQFVGRTQKEQGECLESQRLAETSGNPVHNGKENGMPCPSFLGDRPVPSQYAWMLDDFDTDPTLGKYSIRKETNVPEVLHQPHLHSNNLADVDFTRVKAKLASLHDPSRTTYPLIARPRRPQEADPPPP